MKVCKETLKKTVITLYRSTVSIAKPSTSSRSSGKSQKSKKKKKKKKKKKTVAMAVEKRLTLRELNELLSLKV